MPPLSKRQKAARKRARADACGFAANVAEAPASKQLPMVVGWNPVTKAISGQLLLLPCTDGWFGAGSDADGEPTDSSDSDSGDPGGEAAVPATERIAAAAASAMQPIKSNQSRGYNREAKRQWRSDKEPQLRRNRAAAAAAAMSIRPLTAFFKPAPAPEPIAEPDSASSGSSSCCDSDLEPGQVATVPPASLGQTLVRLEAALAAAKQREDPKATLTLGALRLLCSKRIDGRSIHQACRAAAEAFYPLTAVRRAKAARLREKKGERSRERHYRYRAVKLRQQFQVFLSTGALPSSVGRPRGDSLIYDEDVKRICRAVIGQLPKRWHAREFRRAASKALIKAGHSIGGPKTSLIGLKTTALWLQVLGAKLIHEKKGLYKDGHEREDVVQYRKSYVTQHKDLEPR